MLLEIDFAEGVNGEPHADRGGEEDPDRGGVSSAHEAAPDQAGGEVVEESPQENQEQGLNFAI